MEKNERGIFCIEAFEENASMKPTLDLLAHLCDFPRPMHRQVTDRGGLVRSLREWAGREDWKYPILYLSMHGFPKGLHVHDPKGAGFTRVDLDTVSDILADHAAGSQGMSGTMLHFGACSTLADDELRRFFQATRLTAVSGYRKLVPWVESVALELLYLSCVQKLMSDYQGDGGGIPTALMERARDEVMDSRKCHGLVDALGFRMFVSGDFD